jgi:uncharacterized protein (TIGR00106 family)
MVAQFSIYPLGHTHLSKDIAEVVQELRAEGLHFQLGPLSTAVEGDWEQVLNAIHRCHRHLVEKHKRVITTIVIDDSLDGHNLQEMVAAVEGELVAHKKKADAEC